MTAAGTCSLRIVFHILNKLNKHIPSGSGIYYAGTGGIFIRSSLSNFQWLFTLTAGILFAIILYLFAQDSLTALISRQENYDRLIMNWHCTPGLLIYLLLCRCLPFFLLLLLTLRTGKSFFFHLYFAYIGFIYGAQCLLSADAYQFYGLLLCFFRLAPQIIFYLPALFFAWHLTDIPGHSPVFNRKSLFLISLFLWIIGISAEWGLNPYFLRFGIRLLL